MKIYSFSTPLFPSCEEGILNPLPSPLPLQKGEGCNRSSCRSEPLRSKVGIFSKINPSFFNIKEGSTSHLGLLPSGKKRKPLLSIVFTTPSVPLVGDRNVALNRFAIRLAGHQSPRQDCFSGDEPAGRRLAKMVVRDGTAGGDLLKPMVIRDGTAGTR